jgi:myosin heavy chain 6/7
LENELENEARRVREAVANQRKAERINKEILAQTEEERRQLAEIGSLNEQLNLRIKQYKRQLEEAVSRLLHACTLASNMIGGRG